MKKHPVEGSHRDSLEGAKLVRKVKADERFSVTVLLRPKADLKKALAKIESASPRNRQYLTRDEFRETYGAKAQDIEAVEKFAGQNSLDVASVDVARRSVVLSGRADSFQKAFSVKLGYFKHPGGTYRGRKGSIFVPAELAPIVVGVFGLDNRPQARTHFRLSKHGVKPKGKGAAASFTPPQVAQLYGFPSQVDGTGETIAIIELGGGYSPADLSAYFSGLGVQAPDISSVSVDGGQNAPVGNPNSADGEVLLDIEVAGSIATGARFVVYFGSQQDNGFLDALTTAVHDTVRHPSVVSISWGGPESTWSQQAKTAFDQALQEAAALGVTVLVAAGDDGSSDGVKGGKPNVDFPASSPYATACGGTRLVAAGGSIASETVWNDGAQGGATGGGVSAFFPKPSWQANAGVPPAPKGAKKGGRGVPDVCGVADPDTGFQIRVDGSNIVVGGTSGVAPLWAALVALLNQSRGKAVGYLNPSLYGVLHPALRDITQGNNGAYAAKPGWDACTGWGSPDGNALNKLLGS
jgi:kumamolisin